MKLVIKNANVILPGEAEAQKLDILSENGVITDIAPGISGGGEVIDAAGMYALPGLVDIHCHLRDPGFEYKEDIASGAKAAVAGGFTSLVCMPNTNPVCDNKAVVVYIVETAKKLGLARVYPCGAITKGQKGEQLAEMESMKAAGAVAVSDDGRPVADAALMKKALVYAGMLNMPVIAHSEDLSLSGAGCVNEGEVSTMLGLAGIPAAAEEVCIARDVLLAEYTKTPVHITHVSAAGSVRIIRQAKARGVKVTCDTCPHYFSLTETEVLGYNQNAKVNPPLRTQEDVKAIIEGLVDGTIDCIATDHAPHHEDEKNTEFDQAANGLIGLETALAVAYTYLVKPGYLMMGDIARLISQRPASLLSLPGGVLERGKPADITIFDPGAEYTYSVNDIVSKSKNTPYIGKSLWGRVVATVVGGKVIFRA